MYTNILIDADDTLLDFQKAQLYGFQTVLEHYGFVFSQELYDTYLKINHSLWSKFEKDMIDKDTVQKERFFELFKSINKEVDGYEADHIYQQSLENQTWLLPYAEEVCKNISTKCTLTIVTNGVGRTQKKRITSSAISPYITNIFISEDIGIAKPDKRFFDFVLNAINCYDTRKILLVGDSITSDIKGANNANIDACWYNPYMKVLNQNFTVRYIISDLRQLLEII